MAMRIGPDGGVKRRSALPMFFLGREEHPKKKKRENTEGTEKKRSKRDKKQIWRKKLFFIGRLQVPYMSYGDRQL
jgi:hypothetical protein